MNRYWKPVDNLMHEVESIIENDFRNFYVIGLQIRSTFWKQYTPDIDYVKSFIECAMEIEENYNKNTSSNAKSVKWYISADNNLLIEKFKAKYPEKIIVADGVVAHVAYDNHGYRRTILDIELLSRTDMMVVSGGSTFGFIASLKSERFNYVISRDKKCKKVTLSSPGYTPDFKNVI